MGRGLKKKKKIKSVTENSWPINSIIIFIFIYLFIFFVKHNIFVMIQYCEKINSQSKIMTNVNLTQNNNLSI